MVIDPSDATVTEVRTYRVEAVCKDPECGNVCYVYAQGTPAERTQVTEDALAIIGEEWPDGYCPKHPPNVSRETSGGVSASPKGTK